MAETDSTAENSVAENGMVDSFPIARARASYMRLYASAEARTGALPLAARSRRLGTADSALERLSDSLASAAAAPFDSSPPPFLSSCLPPLASLASRAARASACEEHGSGGHRLR